MCEGCHCFVSTLHVFTKFGLNLKDTTDFLSDHVTYVGQVQINYYT